MTRKPRQVLFRPRSGRPRHRRPPSIGLASAGATSRVMTATCTRPAIRIGAVSQTARLTRDVTAAPRSGAPAPAIQQTSERIRKRDERDRRRPSVELDAERRFVGSLPHLSRRYSRHHAQSVGAGWVRITGAGILAILLASVPFAREDHRRGVQFLAAAVGSFLFQQILIARALANRDEGEPDDLDAVDALTLSRGLAASIVAASAFAGPRDRWSYAARIAWPLALSGSTLTDWIDGPLARRRGRGPTRLGRVLDLELDSSLTLATTLAATRLGTLDAICLVTPSLRYLAMASPISYEDVHAVGKSERARNLGITQMTLALASFAPFAGAATTAFARIASLVLLPIHVFALAAALPVFRRPR